MNEKRDAKQICAKNIAAIEKKNRDQQTVIQSSVDRTVNAQKRYVRLDSIPKHFFDLQAFLEMPFFSLKKEILKTDKIWQREDKTAYLIRHKIDTEQPTLIDKTVFVFVISQVLQHLNYHTNGPIPSNISIPTICFFHATNSNKSGRDYSRLRKSIERLCAAKFTLYSNRNNAYNTSVFRIFEAGEVSGKEIKVTISDWVRSRISNREVLKLHQNYLQTRGIITRRIYEICRKHCGKNSKFSIRKEVLTKRIGSTSQNQRFLNKEIVKFNSAELGYSIAIERNGFLTIIQKN